LQLRLLAAHFVLRGDESSASLLEVCSQLLLLFLQGGAALLEAAFLLEQRGLLSRHGRRLDAEGFRLCLPRGGLGQGEAPPPGLCQCTRNSNGPTRRRSPSASRHAVTRCPLTKVPGPLSRSRRTRPPGVCRMAQCRGATSSTFRRISQPGDRPIKLREADRR